MPHGNLVVQLTDLAGVAVPTATVDLTPARGETGGEPVTVTVSSGVTDLTITRIPCRDAAGTLYRVGATSPHYRPYVFVQAIRENRNNPASDDVEFWVRPGQVKDIQARAYEDLNASVIRILATASMVAVNVEDRDLLNLSGPALYGALGPLRQACFLNIVTKLGHQDTTGDCLPSVRSLLLCRQDRFFATVSDELPERVCRSALFNSAPKQLHDPLPGYTLTTDPSFKSRDPHANLQLTFMRNLASGALAADIDIDESSGVTHGAEVIRNAVFNKRTNPYLIREFMLAADPIRRSLDPGYRFAF